MLEVCIALDIVILIVIAITFVIVCNKYSELQKRLNIGFNDVSGVISALDKMKEFEEKQENKFVELQDNVNGLIEFQEEVREDYKNQIDKIEELKNQLNEWDVYITKERQANQKQIKRLSNDLQVIKEKFDVMEELFRLQLMNLFLDNAEEALKYYETNGTKEI